MSEVQKILCRLCDRPHKAKGYCGTHYSRLLKHGDATYTEREMHGMKDTRIYKIWENMRARCRYPKNFSYRWYGAKGIKVCDRWNNSFNAFYEDMKDGYTDEMTIERLDNSKDYSPENCTWIKREQQPVNRQKTTKINSDIANKIRAEYSKGGISQDRIADMYGVSQTLVSVIVRNVLWKEESHARQN